MAVRFHGSRWPSDGGGGDLNFEEFFEYLKNFSYEPRRVVSRNSLNDGNFILFLFWLQCMGDE